MTHSDEIPGCVFESLLLPAVVTPGRYPHVPWLWMALLGRLQIAQTWRHMVCEV